MSKIFNKRVQRLVELQENCHCTRRSITGDSMSEARDLVSKELRGYIYWDFYGTCCRLTVKTGGIGVKHKTMFDETNSDAEINAKLKANFVKMDATWGTNE